MMRKLLSICFTAALLLATSPLALATLEVETVSTEENILLEETEFPNEIASSTDTIIQGEDLTEEPSLAGTEGLPIEEELPKDAEPSTDGELPTNGEENGLTSDGETSVEETPPIVEGEKLPPAEEGYPALEEIPVIHVTVPSQGKIIVNPYCLRVMMDGKESTEQIVSGEYELVNQSEVAVIVTSSATGRPQGAAVITATPPEREATGREVFLFVEFQNAASAWSNAYTGAPNQLLVTPDGSVSREVMTIGALESGYFRLSGAASTTPAEMWREEDTVNVTLTFTFSPVLAE